VALRVGLVAGETSGDTLGAALISAIRARVPDAQFFGMAGPKMVALGCEAWASSDDLGVMGLVEVLTHLPRLLRLRRMLTDRFREARPDVVVGIDVPDFNLGLEKKLKRAGLRTVQYVSPQVWAWRQGRVKTIGQSTDLVLCLLPFETEFYTRHGVRRSSSATRLRTRFPSTSIGRARGARWGSTRRRAWWRSCPAAGWGKWSASPRTSSARRPGLPRVSPPQSSSRQWLPGGCEKVSRSSGRS
jgi:hypothetical protein